MSQQTQLFDLPSGAKLSVTVSSFVDAWGLMKASLKTLKGAELKASDLQVEAKTLLENPAIISVIADRIIEFSTSPEVESALWKCAQRALYIPANSKPEYPGTQLVPALFDSPEYGIEAREDYAKIVFSLLEVNCKPFLAKALSGFLKPRATSSESQPLK